MCDRKQSQSAHQRSNTSNDNERGLNKSVDFSDYMWMVEEEIDDFDKKCEEEFWEDHWLQEAFEEMLEEEEISSTQYYMVPPELLPSSGSMESMVYEYLPEEIELENEIMNINFNNAASLQTQADDNTNSSGDVSVRSMTPLNPEAPVFVPRSMMVTSHLDQQADDITIQDGAGDDGVTTRSDEWPQEPGDNNVDR